MRHDFATLISQAMHHHPRLWVVTGDLGYGVWDQVRTKYPNRFINVGAAEQSLVGVSVGLATAGQIPLAYSITPFLLYRPFETIRNYLHHDQLPVKLIGSGRNTDYATEGFSHWATEDRQVMAILSGITARWPRSPSSLPKLIDQMLDSNKPWYVNLKR